MSCFIQETHSDQEMRWTGKESGKVNFFLVTNPL